MATRHDVLQVNTFDGSQHTAYPAGDKPAPGVTLEKPTSPTVSGITTDGATFSWSYGGTGHDGFNVERFIGAGQWTEIEVVGDVRSVTDYGDIPANTAAGYRVRARKD